MSDIEAERKAAILTLLSLPDEPPLRRGHIRTHEANLIKAFQTIAIAHQRHAAYVLGELKILHVNGDAIGTY